MAVELRAELRRELEVQIEDVRLVARPLHRGLQKTALDRRAVRHREGHVDESDAGTGSDRIVDGHAGLLQEIDDYK
jgi:hypothetical protein